MPVGPRWLFGGAYRAGARPGQCPGWCVVYAV